VIGLSARPPLSALLSVLFVLGLFAAGAAPAMSQGPATASVTGVVTSETGARLGGAAVSLSGAASAHTTSDAQGKFSFANLPAGIYTISVTKSGFVAGQQANVAVLSGQTVQATFLMKPESYQTLNVIGHVSTSAQLPLNTSPASVDVIDANTLSLTGSHEVIQALEEIPGITVATQNYGGGNGLADGASQVVQIRGALPYETQNLIDGHPVSEGSSATFSPTFLNPWLLDSIEVVKGPGYIGPDINYAITGTVNYHTLSPTATPRESFDIDYNALLNGLSSNFRATGTTLQGHLGYAFDYAIFGSAGVNPGTELQPGQWTYGSFNGKALGDLGGFLPTPSGYVASPGFTTNTLAICCFSNFSNQYTSRAELAKLQFNFSTETSLTATYLGSQVLQNPEGDQPLTPSTTFTPGAGYTGSIPAGIQLPFINAFYGSFQEETGTGLFESEFRTAVTASDALLARYYTGAQNDNTAYCTSFTVCNGLSFPVTLYGTGTLNGVTTVFNGTQGTLTSPYYYDELSYDHFRGFSAEWDHLAGNNTYSVSFDRSQHTDASGYTYESPTFYPTIADGSAETFQTILARAELALTPALQATVGYYDINYTSHYTPDGGVTFANSEHNLNAGRAALTYRLDHDTSLRLSAGESIAPPTIALITTPAGPPLANSGGTPTYYTQVLPSGNVAPETAFSYDLGFDKRLPESSMLFSADLYTTALQNQFLNSVTLAGMYTPTTGINTGLTRPLYDQTTENLGYSRYAGIEFLIHRKPVAGIGFKVQGGLERAYVYDLPSTFYATGAGPYTTNLGIVQGINYNGSGNGYSGVGFGRIPYATGYAELNWTLPKRLFALVGVQYFGNNNSFNAPAFAEVNATVRWTLRADSWLQLSATNITNQLSADFPYYDSGIAVPLANSQVGWTDLNNLGPTQVTLSFHHQFGPK
jgi:outer membrane receptor protein involved in Fe transport